jgi:hypothetical protein
VTHKLQRVLQTTSVKVIFIFTVTLGHLRRCLDFQVLSTSEFQRSILSSSSMPNIIVATHKRQKLRPHPCENVNHILLFLVLLTYNCYKGILVSNTEAKGTRIEKCQGGMIDLLF